MLRPRAGDDPGPFSLVLFLARLPEQKIFLLLLRTSCRFLPTTASLPFSSFSRRFASSPPVSCASWFALPSLERETVGGTRSVWMDLHPPSGLEDHPVEMTTEVEMGESRTDENTREEGKEGAIEILKEISRSYVWGTVGSDGGLGSSAIRGIARPRCGCFYPPLPPICSPCVEASTRTRSWILTARYLSLLRVPILPFLAEDGPVRVSPGPPGSIGGSCSFRLGIGFGSVPSPVPIQKGGDRIGWVT